MDDLGQGKYGYVNPARNASIAASVARAASPWTSPS